MAQARSSDSGIPAPLQAGPEFAQPTPAGEENENHIANQLEFAIRRAKYNTVQDLVKALPDVINHQYEPSRSTPLHLACLLGHKEIIECLVDAGADLYYSDRRGWNSLQLAIKSGRLDIVKYLVDKSSHPRDFVKGCRTDGTHKSLLPLHVAIQAGDLQIVEFLIEKGADPKSRDSNRDTAVIQACLAGRTQLMKHLIKKKHSHVDDKGHGGRTSLSVLAEMNQDDDIVWLIDNEADASIKVGGKTAWDIAYRERNLLALSAFAQKEMEQEVEQFDIENPGENDEPRRNPQGIAQPDGNSHVPTSDEDNSVKYILQNLRPIDIYGLETLTRRFEVPWYHLNGNNRTRIYGLLRRVSRLKGNDEIETALNAIFRQIHDNFSNIHESEAWLEFREPSCVFGSFAENSSGSSRRSGQSPEFCSLAMPYFYSDIPSSYSGIAERKDRYKSLTTCKYCCSTDTTTLGLQVPVTMDEYCKPALDQDALKERNEDQVLQRSGFNKLIIIPQIWIWKIGRHVITASPAELPAKRWVGTAFGRMCERAYAKPTSVKWDGIDYRSGQPSPEALVSLILSDCVDILDRPTMAGLPEPIFNVFEKSISKLSAKVKNYLKSTQVRDISVVDEKTYLHEINDIREELSMIKTVVLQQEEVWKDFMSNAWPQLWPKNPDEQLHFDSPSPSSWDPASDKEMFRLMERPQNQFRKYKRRIEKLDEDADRVQQSILTLLDLKSKHASLEETHNTTLMSAAVLGFSVVTIIFTPLSFLTSLFALPTQQLQKHHSGVVNGTSVYSNNYVGGWMTMGELVSLAVTVLAVWVALKNIMDVNLFKIGKKVGKPNVSAAFAEATRNDTSSNPAAATASAAVAHSGAQLDLGAERANQRRRGTYWPFGRKLGNSDEDTVRLEEEAV